MSVTQNRRRFVMHCEFWRGLGCTLDAIVGETHSAVSLRLSCDVVGSRCLPLAVRLYDKGQCWMPEALGEACDDCFVSNLFSVGSPTTAMRVFANPK